MRLTWYPRIKQIQSKKKKKVKNLEEYFRRKLMKH